MAKSESDTTHAAATDLLPCPFCGGPAVDRACGHGRRYVGCDTCEIGLSYNVATAGYPLAPPFGVRERAAWNGRTDPPSPGGTCAKCGRVIYSNESSIHKTNGTDEHLYACPKAKS